MDITFTSERELYERLLPALKIKKRKIYQFNSIKVSEQDIWDYFKKNIWQDKINLTLAGMLDDLLNISIKEIIDNIKNS